MGQNTDMGRSQPGASAGNEDANFKKFPIFGLHGTTLGFVRLHQSRSGLAWIGIKSMPQSMPQNNP
jgi:hypothetical protein